MILTALQSASIRLMGQRPSTFYGSSQKFEIELTDLANEVAQDVAKYQDWQALTKIGTLNGVSGVSDFILPGDYDRQLSDADIQRTVSWYWGYTHYTNLNEFMSAKNSGIALQPGGWTIYGGKMRFHPAPVGEAQYPYITKNWALGSDGVSKPAFTADTDTFLLPERLLTLGLVWRWRENKKLDAAGDQEAFIKALDEYAAKDRGSTIIRRNGVCRPFNTSIPYTGTAF